MPGSWSRFLLARLPVIVLITLAVMAGAALVAWSQTPEYKSEADVVAFPAASAASSGSAQSPNMATEKGIASSGVVLATASRSLHVPQSELRDGLSVNVPVDADLLTISFTNPDPQVARTVAQGLADAYVAYRTPVKQASRKGQTSITEPPGAVQAAVITPASLPESPSSPNLLLDVGVAVILGIALGIGVALVRDRMDDRLRGADDLETQSGSPVLAVIPAFPRHERDLARRLAVVRSPGSAAADAYRNLRTRVLLAAAWGGAKNLLVAGPGREDKATVAANLAAALALSGRRVVLVCADVRWPRTQELFNVAGPVGLTSVVDGSADLTDAIQHTEVPGLELLPAGPVPADPGTVTQSRALPDVLDEIYRRTDFVVIDAPAVLTGADTSALAELADMVLLVADARRSTRAQVRAAVHEMEHVRAALIGCVLDNAGRHRRLPASQSAPATAGEAAGTWPLQGSGRADDKAAPGRHGIGLGPAHHSGTALAGPSRNAGEDEQ